MLFGPKCVEFVKKNRGHRSNWVTMFTAVESTRDDELLELAELNKQNGDLTSDCNGLKQQLAQSNQMLENWKIVFTDVSPRPNHVGLTFLE